jgi:hypothetical protein
MTQIGHRHRLLRLSILPAISSPSRPRLGGSVTTDTKVSFRRMRLSPHRNLRPDSVIDLASGSEKTLRDLFHGKDAP